MLGDPLDDALNDSLDDAPGLGLSARRSTSSGDQAAGPRAVYDFSGGFGQPFPAGYHPYPTAVLESFRPFVPPAGLKRLNAQLRLFPVAVLRGPTGAGKQAAALGLLASLGVHRFYAVDPDAQFRILDLRPVPPGSGLVLAGLPTAAAARLRRLDLDRIGQMLEGRESWLVLTADEDTQWTDPDLAELTVGLPAGPPVREVVEVHLRDRLGGGGSGGAGALLAHPGLAGQIASLPAGLSCADAAALGRLLARHEADPDAAVERFRQLAGSRAEREIVDWFGGLGDPATRFTAIALTFAEGEPMETVSAIADTLDSVFPAESRRAAGHYCGHPNADSDDGKGDASGGGQSDVAGGGAGDDAPGGVLDAVAGPGPGFDSGVGPDSDLDSDPDGGIVPDPFRSGRPGRLRDIRDLAGNRIVRIRADSGAEQRAEFVDPEFGDRLLRHVWTEYYPIRPALLRLIAGLGTHPSALVRRRAVASVGALVAETGSFERLLAAVVEPWATAEDPGRNEAAALALMAACSADEDLRASIRVLIAVWARSETTSLRATAGWMLGRSIGLAGSGAVAAADSGLTTALLTELAEDEQAAVVDAICHALTLGIDVPDDAATESAAMAVFELLGEWIEHGTPRAGRVAELTVLTMATLLVRQGDPRRDGSAGGPDVARLRPESPPTKTQEPDSVGPKASDGPEEWPGLIWLAERSPELNRSAGRLLAAALASTECGRSARGLLNRWAVQAEPHQHRREALTRLLFPATGHESARRVLIRQAGVWTREPEALAPKTGALVTRMLNIT